MVRRVARVDRLDERLLGAPAGIGPCLEDVVEPLVPQAVHLGIGERGPADHLGQQLHCRLEALAWDLDAGGHRVPARLRVERRAEPLGGLDEGDRVVVLGPLGQGAGGQDRGPGGGGRLVDRAVAQHERRRHERTAGQRHRDDREPVRQSIALEPRERVRPGMAGGRPLGDDDIGHGATSSVAAAASAAVPSSAPAFEPGAGRYVTTARLSARNTDAATSRIASGVTAR